MGRKKKAIPEIVHTREDYIKNCLFWINEYFKGGCDIKHFESAMFNLNKYAHEIENEKT
jgi:hypothetical protein